LIAEIIYVAEKGPLHENLDQNNLSAALGPAWKQFRAPNKKTKRAGQR